MKRNFNTTTDGLSFPGNTKLRVWQRARGINGRDLAVWRQDPCGAPIKWSAFGTTKKYGWEIDHINPVSRGGGDKLSNLQALQWQNNRAKGDKRPSEVNYCVVTYRKS